MILNTTSILSVYFVPFLVVLIPKGKYRGQKLTKLVSNIIIANAPKTRARVPLITSIKYNTNTKIAIAIRIILSVNPMLDFIVFFFKF